MIGRTGHPESSQRREGLYLMSAKEFVTQFFDRWQKGDSGPFFAALAADLVWTAQGTTPISGRYEGNKPISTIATSCSSRSSAARSAAR